MLSSPPRTFATSTRRRQAVSRSFSQEKTSAISSSRTAPVRPSEQSTKTSSSAGVSSTRFCKEYYKQSGYRCDLLNVGYSIAQDKSSLFSYTRDGPGLTLDPVSSGSKGWIDFLTAYNEWCARHNGKPLFNQSRGITPEQARASFGPEIDKFQEYRKKYDPDDRFYTEFFKELFEGVRGSDA